MAARPSRIKSKPSTTTPDLGIIGSTGLKQYHGLIYEEYLTELQGTRWIQVIKEMANDPVLGAVLFAIEMLIRRVSFKVEPYTGEGEDSPDAPTADPSQADQDKRVAEACESCLYDMETTWEDTLSDVLTMLPYGFSMQEQGYKVRRGETGDPTTQSKFNDGLVGWRKWVGLSQDTLFRWEFDDENTVVGFHQLAPPKFIPEFIPLSKAMLFRTTAKKGNPEGASIFRAAYRPWYLAKNIENIEGVGIERDLAGLPIAEVPASYLSTTASSDDKAFVTLVKQIVTNIRRDEQEGIVWPQIYDDAGHPMFTLKLLNSGGARQFDTDKVIARHKQHMAMVVLADFVLLGHEKVGSFALATSKTNIFGNAISAWLDAICAEINEHGFPRLMKMNGWDTSRRPTLTHGDIQGADLAEVANYLLKLAQSGAVLFPNPDLTRHLLELADLPAPPVADEGDWPTTDAQELETETSDPFPKQGNPVGGMAPAAAAAELPKAAAPTPISKAEEQTGAMVALMLAPNEAGQLALDEPGAEPADQLHITLAYLGEAAQIKDVDRLKAAVAGFAVTHAPITGHVQGMGRFTKVPAGKPTPVYASFDSPELPAWRQDLAQLLTKAGFPPAADHGFVPHITLAYLDSIAPTPAKPPAHVGLRFQQITLAVAGKQYDYPLTANRS